MKSRDGCVEASRREFALGGLVLSGLLTARGTAIAADPGAAETAGPAAADVLANLMEAEAGSASARLRSYAVMRTEVASTHGAAKS